jgi:hypothetical protein
MWLNYVVSCDLPIEVNQGHHQLIPIELPLGIQPGGVPKIVPSLIVVKQLMKSLGIGFDRTGHHDGSPSLGSMP